jgi:hypothetical protein
MYDVNFENNVQEFEIQEIPLADRLNLLDINDVEDIAELPF